MNDRLRHVESQIRRLQDFVTRHFARLPVMPVAETAAGFDRCKATAFGAFTAADATFTVDNVIATKGDSPLSDPDDTTEQLTVENDFDWDGDDNATVFIEHHQDDDKWHAYQVTCPSQS